MVDGRNVMEGVVPRWGVAVVIWEKEELVDGVICKGKLKRFKGNKKRSNSYKAVLSVLCDVVEIDYVFTALLLPILRAMQWCEFTMPLSSNLKQRMY